jgi:hypothetical protein
MKKLFLHAILMATAVVSMAQSPRANYFKSLFSPVSGHNTAIKLKAALTSPVLQLDSGVYAGESKVVFSYNENGTCRSHTGYKMDNLTTQWKPDYLYKTFYDENGNDTLNIISIWNSNTSSWKQYVKQQITYTSNGKDYTSNNYYWSEDQWETDTPYKHEFFCDNNGNDTLEIAYYKPSSSDWQKWYKMSYVYDESGNCISSTDYNWYLDSWDYDNKSEFTYDNNYSYEDLIMPQTRFNLKHKLTKESQYSYNSSSSSWDYDGEIVYYYSPRKTSLGIKPITTSKLKASVQDGLLLISGITTDTPLSVYNMQGVALYNQKVSSNTVTIPAPDNGLYIVRNGVQNVKVVKR